MLMSGIGEVDAATAAQQVLIPVEVNVLVVPELSLGKLTQVEQDRTEAWVDQEGGMANPVVSTTLHSSSRTG